MYQIINHSPVESWIRCCAAVSRYHAHVRVLERSIDARGCVVEHGSAAVLLIACVLFLSFSLECWECIVGRFCCVRSLLCSAVAARAHMRMFHCCKQ